MRNHRAHDRLDRATSERLARLAARPIDTSGLESRLEAAMHDAIMEDAAPTRPIAIIAAWQRSWRPMTSAAAAILIVVAIGWLVLDGGTSPAMAAPAALAQIHYDVANGLAPHLKVSGVDEANQLLTAQASGAVPMPQLPGAMRSCCLHPYAGTTLTCALIEQDGQLITVAVADGREVHSPGGTTITRNGKPFTVHAANGINMVMAHEGDRWLCVMGEASTEVLVAIAEGIEL